MKASIKVMQIADHGLWVMIIFALYEGSETKDVIATIYADTEWQLAHEARKRLNTMLVHYRDTIRAIDDAFTIIHQHEMNRIDGINTKDV